MSKLKVMYEGILDLANCKIPCYVLEDGTRVLSGRQMQTALKLTDDMSSSIYIKMKMEINIDLLYAKRQHTNKWI